ncbi:MAG: hypothetical protein PHF57_05910 [Methanoregula sp.]|jgi:hypothetical protein|nr:hypothetical protein [Methanoregula sp.]MDD5187724.1 hypothetical protein [Methanoregula sp.]
MDIYYPWAPVANPHEHFFFTRNQRNPRDTGGHKQNQCATFRKESGILNCDLRDTTIPANREPMPVEAAQPATGVDNPHPPAQREH